MPARFRQGSLLISFALLLSGGLCGKVRGTRSFSAKSESVPLDKRQLTFVFSAATKEADPRVYLFNSQARESCLAWRERVLGLAQERIQHVSDCYPKERTCDAEERCIHDSTADIIFRAYQNLTMERKPFGPKSLKDCQAYLALMEKSSLRSYLYGDCRVSDAGSWEAVTVNFRDVAGEKQNLQEQLQRLTTIPNSFWRKETGKEWPLHFPFSLPGSKLDEEDFPAQAAKSECNAWRERARKRLAAQLESLDECVIDQHSCITQLETTCFYSYKTNLHFRHPATVHTWTRRMENSLGGGALHIDCEAWLRAEQTAMPEAYLHGFCRNTGSSSGIYRQNKYYGEGEIYLLEPK